VVLGGLVGLIEGGKGAGYAELLLAVLLVLGGCLMGAMELAAVLADAEVSFLFTLLELEENPKGGAATDDEEDGVDGVGGGGGT